MRLAALSLGTAAVLALGLVPALPATAASSGSRLVVADAAADRLYVYAVPSHRLLATFTGRTFADHTGMLPLKDGRVLFVDEANRQLVALQTSGSPRIVGTAPLPEGEFTHLAADPSGRHAVVAAAEEHDHEEEEASKERQEAAKATKAEEAEEEDGHGTLTVVDLRTYGAWTAEIHTGHPGVAFGEGTVVHRNDADNTFETYPIADIVAAGGGEVEPTSTVPIGAGGHGEAYTGGLVLSATNAGLDTARLTGGVLSPVRTVAWPATGRAYYLRVSADGRRLAAYSSDESGDDWQNWRHESFLVDPVTGSSVTAPLGTGFLFRHGLSDRHAGYVMQRPANDIVSFVKVRPGVPGYGTVSSTVTLPRLPGGPVVGTSPWSAQFRRIALQPNGSLAYVTGGGTGKITVISPDLGRVVGTINVPTSLDGGGAVTVVTPGADSVDKIGR
ncbi:hypothetical protein ACIBCT_22690 [Streptosporangium sp. NPDC050855]|uniref:hypothetical protein n=1 Tax=Streptosporangium sp. NPDC050855 TaxID=3366194 RepID=UPI00378B89C2